MARTDSLGNFLTDIANAIRNKKGTTDTIVASNFDTEIASIESGGGTVNITTVTELNNVFFNVIMLYKDYLSSIVNSYDLYTEEPVTLYTPSANNKYYLIRKKGQSSYGIVWFPERILTYETSIAVETQDITIHALVYLDKVTSESIIAKKIYSGVNAYLSPDYSTFEECINAIQNPSTTYSTAGSSSWTSYADGNYDICCSNLPYLKKDETPGRSRKISSNETIEVIE